VTRTEFIAEPGVPQAIIVRSFDAPRELVFRAHTEAGLLARWLGPADHEMAVHRLDARHGGQWRFTQRAPDGTAFTFHGLFHGTPSPDAIVQTWECDAMPGIVYLNTITLEERGGTTVLRQNTVYQSVEDRDAYVTTGAEEGARQSMDRLAKLLAEQTI
jgi:uncharacterized protein YndB with AHSA1/START domain